ncbi:MAG TPA: ATPase domain-containing protein [Thermoplasmata archaeon]|nr:ATPase domain-containing protein [Thermoplasmata archaeon]
MDSSRPAPPAAAGASPPAVGASGVLERCETGIEALDAILAGGIPRGNMVLVAGSVGTGKTTLTLEFLIRGAERGERSLFLSVTEASAKLVQNVASFEFFKTSLIEDGSLVMVDLPAVTARLGFDRDELSHEDLDLLLRTIRDLVKNLGVRRLVLDSITSLGYRIPREEQIRDFLLRLGELLAEADCTALIVSEIAPEPGRYSTRGVEEAIVDGIILLRNIRRLGDILRVLQVVKMRGTPHSRALYVLELTPIGILLAPHLKGGRSYGE